jgi:hypothetical protein
LDLDRSHAEKFLEERRGFKKLGTRMAWLAPVRDSSPAIRTSASTPMESGSLLSGRATQILQGGFPALDADVPSRQQAWHDKHSRTEEHCTIEVD